MEERRWVAQPSGWPARTVSVPAPSAPVRQETNSSSGTDALKTPVYTPPGATRVYHLSFPLPPLYNVNDVPLSEGKLQVQYSAGRTTWQTAVAEVERAMTQAFGTRA
eukprot:Gregarina_sp_Pseudo_9__3836@NODE_398_length_2924_cov_29_748007_g375_i0_p6_GENE_NODE_398_length_2924_cov_29_748007_g375_i0NODE_398_length_2924_cov_29_748007_g375_i0_p6_ORF_typecomplete_len107_score9_32_NODE_398_length_2924_cov_29_748007_g375_i024562776